MAGTVLLWGGAGGVGAALARDLAAKGYDLHLVGRDAARLSALAEALGAGYSVADVTDPEAITQATQAACARANGALAGLVYAVGTITLRPLAKLAPQAFVNDFNVNALGAALALQAAAPALKAHANASGGSASAVLFSSIAVAQGFTNHASISMAKGAVEGLTRALACEWAPLIRVNAIAPSLTQTPLAAALTANPQMASALAQLHPIARLGEAGDSAALAAFLLSPEAGWISGQVMAVDGGRGRLRVKG